MPIIYGNALKLARESRGDSYKDVTENTGIRYKTLKKWEGTGQVYECVEITDEQLQLLVDQFGYPENFFRRVTQIFPLVAYCGWHYHLSK
jgi:transcriptional regulator with XRE-family HTH domain